MDALPQVSNPPRAPIDDVIPVRPCGACLTASQAKSVFADTEPFLDLSAEPVTASTVTSLLIMSKAPTSDLPI